jgi:hypothetical protein
MNQGADDDPAAPQVTNQITTFAWCDQGTEEGIRAPARSNQSHGDVGQFHYRLCRFVPPLSMVTAASAATSGGSPLSSSFGTIIERRFCSGWPGHARPPLCRMALSSSFRIVHSRLFAISSIHGLVRPNQLSLSDELRPESDCHHLRSPRSP